MPKLTLIVGNMFSGKSQDLIERATAVEKFQEHHILCFKPDIDTRTPGVIHGRNGEFLPALEVPWKHPRAIFKLLYEAERKNNCFYETLVFDELQFYPGADFYEVVSQLLKTHNIMAAGLPLNFRGQPFGATLALTWLSGSDTVRRVSYCAKCHHNEAPDYPQRLYKDKTTTDWTPSHYDEEVIVIDPGIEEQVENKRVYKYEPRCPDCFELPGRPNYA